MPRKRKFLGIDKSNNFPKQFPYHLEPKLKRKLDKLIEQLEKNDVWILIDGDEGSGKTNTAAYILYYFHCMTGREFSEKNFYFDSEEMFNYVKSNENKLINWDEAALGGLSTEWWSRAQTNIYKFGVTGRKKHHVFILCIPKFDMLREYLRLDRTHALIHMDLGKRRDSYGNCMWITRRGKSHLNRIWKTKKWRDYNGCMKKGGGFYFYVPYVMSDLINLDAYEKKKDEAIEGIGKTKNVVKEDNKLKILQYKIAKLNPRGITTKKELAKALDIPLSTVETWAGMQVPEAITTTTV